MNGQSVINTGVVHIMEASALNSAGAAGAIANGRNNLINTQTINNGFFDPSDRSTTAGTAFP